MTEATVQGVLAGTLAALPVGILIDPRTGALMGGSGVRKDGLAIGY